MAQPALPRSVYEETARLFFEYGGNVTAAARASGVGYQTYASRLKKAREMGLADKRASSTAEEKERVVTAKVVLKPVYRIQQRKSKPDETKRVLAIGDCHDGPTLPDKTRFYAMGKYAKDNGVDQIIQIGDFASVDSLNRFDANDTLKGKEKPSFGQDMKSFQEAIRAFHKGLDGYDVPKHVTLGNHEDRIWSYTNKNPEIVDMLDQILFATMDDYNWTYSPYGEFYFIGDVGFTHAPLNTMGKAYGGMQSENSIARDAMHDIVYGHTHKRLDKTFPKIGNQFVNIINLGTSLPEGHIEEYARHTLTGWSYGVYDIQIKDGKIYETNWLPIGKLMKEYGEDMREIKKIIVHCADTPEGRDVRTAEIKRWHTEERGWSDIGYHWVVELDGSLHAGRPEEISGAHCKGHNSSSIGICYVGGSDSEGNSKDTRTEGQRDALVALIKEILDRYPDAEVFGHRDFSTKACPSFDAKTEYAGL